MYASLKKRIYAFFLDYLIIILYLAFIVIISIAFRSAILPLFSSSPVKAEITGFLMVTLPVSLYFILCESSKWQATWGKKKICLHVVDRNGQGIGIIRSIVRTAIKFFPWELAHFCIWRFRLPSDFSQNTLTMILLIVYLVIFIYLFSPLANKKRKSIYDWIAGTEVIRKP